MAKMAADLSAMNYVHIPVRSISLPSRTSHSNSIKIEAELTKLKTWDSLFSSRADPVAAETIQVGLAGLAELFNCIQKLIHSPLTQQAFHHQHLNQVEEALDGSVGFLDVCSTARDLLLAMKEQVQDLQSVLRRRRNDSSIECNIQSYISFRKRTKKDITKSLKALKMMESKAGSFRFPLSDVDNHLSFLMKVMREARVIAVSIFRSLMLFLSMPVTKTYSTGGWSLINKLMRAGLLAPDKSVKDVNEVREVDIALCSIHGQMRKNDAKVDVKEMHRRLRTLDGSINGLEANLDCMFRCLIQNRASLLNLVTP